MAWIESHQDLATNPKTKRAARLLDIPLPHIIGYLHMLWWWTLDHAFDGDVSKFDALDIADAAGWVGDPDAFLTALMECGPGDKAGFITNDMRLNDWKHFTQHLQVRREASAKAHHVRWHEGRGVAEPSCPHCEPDANALRTQAIRNAPEPEPNPTNLNPGRDTKEKLLTTRAREEESPHPNGDGFDDFWDVYPRHATSGKPGGGAPKSTARAKWQKLKPADRSAALVAVAHYADWITGDPDAAYPKHATTWLNQRCWEDWLQPAERAPPSRQLPRNVREHIAYDQQLAAVQQQLEQEQQQTQLRAIEGGQPP